MRERCWVVVLVLLFVSGCSSNLVGTTAEGAAIVRVPLRLSNAYLIESKPPVLIDTGTLGDMEDLSRALHENGVRVNELGLVIVTHGHADHAGLARELRDDSGAKIVLGAGDIPLARAGHNDELMPTGFEGKMLKPLIPDIYPSFTPDIALDRPLSLESFGISGTVMPMPGHTAGSLVVLLSNHAAFVGDMMAGGIFGGMFMAKSPNGHLFQADRERNKRNIAELVNMGVQTFYVGHGGPLSRADVIAAFGL